MKSFHVRRLALWAAALAVSGGVAAIAGPAPAQAAVPNAWAFALVLSPSGPVNATHWAESKPSPTPTAVATGPGVEVVRFRNIGFFKGGVVHVTAVTDQLAWCQAQSWRTLGGSELVTVRCFVKGVAAFVPFTVTYSQSSGTLAGGLSYAYVSHGTTSGSSYNSTGHANTVTALGVLILVGGGMEVVGAFWCQEWSGFFLALLSGVLGVVVGLMLLGNPIQGGITLTILLAMAFNRGDHLPREPCTSYCMST